MRKPRQLKKNAYYHVSNKFHKLVQITMNPRIKKRLLELIHAAKAKFKMKIKNICILLKKEGVIPLYIRKMLYFCTAFENKCGKEVWVSG